MRRRHASDEKKFVRVNPFFLCVKQFIAQVNALDLASAQSLFSITLAVTVAGQDYLIESIASNDAFGQVYLYRLLLREARQQAV